MRKTEFDPRAEIKYFARDMRRHGELPKSPAGVREDRFALKELANKEAVQLDKDLTDSAQISHDKIAADTDRATAVMKVNLLKAVADEISEGTTRHPDGTPLTAEEFAQRVGMEQSFAEKLRERAQSERINDEAASLGSFTDSRASEVPVYASNEAIRIFNARRVLGRRAVRVARGISSLSGTVGGILTSEAFVTNPSKVSVLSASAGLIAGASAVSSLRNRIERRFAKRRAEKLL